MTDDLQDEVLKHALDIRDRLDARNLTDHDMLIRLNTVSDQIMLSLTDIKDSYASRMSLIEGRLMALEQARWMVLGGAAVLGVIASVVTQFLNLKKP